MASAHDALEGASGPSIEDNQLRELGFPFDGYQRISLEAARRDQFFKERYGFESQGDAWRRIDDDWLTAAGPLALQLDSNTNNTSLALAIELKAEVYTTEKSCKQLKIGVPIRLLR